MGRFKSRFNYLVPEAKNVNPRAQHWLPNEIWEGLLLKLSDSEDIRNFCKAYPHFDSILHLTKNCWLFDKVFLVICSYLSLSDMLNCRMVCRKWHLGIEKFMQNQHLHTFLYSGGDRHIPFERRNIHRWIRKNHPFQTSSIISLQQNSPPSLHLSKIICTGKFLELSIPNFERSSSFHEKLAQVVTIFSNIQNSEILHLRLRLSGYEVTYEELIELISTCLANSRGLKSLMILQSMVLQKSVEPKYIPEKNMEQNIFASLREIWPSSLEYLSFDLKSDYQNILTQVCFQLCCYHNFSLNSCTATIPHLRELLITKDLKTLSFGIKSISQLSYLQNITLPLTQLSITVDLYLINDLPAFMTQLVLQLENFKSTLTCLSIAMFSAFYTMKDSEDLGFDITHLNLPYLKELILTEVPAVSWNMFTSLKSLEYFTIHSGNNGLKYTCLLTGQQEIQNVRKYLPVTSENQVEKCHKPYYSNAWKVFPKLRELVIVKGNMENGEQRYRRDIHEAHLLGRCKLQTCKI